MGLEDCEEVDDDNIGQVQLDPSVWAHPMKSHENHGVPNPFCSSIPKADAYIRQHFPNPFQQHVGNQQILSNNQEQQIHALQQQQLQQQQQQHQRVNEVNHSNPQCAATFSPIIHNKLLTIGFSFAAPAATKADGTLKIFMLN